MKVYKVVRVLPSGHRVSAYASGAWAHVYPPLGTVTARKGKLFVFRRRKDAERWLDALWGAAWPEFKILRATTHDSPEHGGTAAQYQKDFLRYWAGKLERGGRRSLPPGTLFVSGLELLE